MRHHVYADRDGEPLVRVNVRQTDKGKRVFQDHWDGDKWLSGANGHSGLLFHHDWLADGSPTAVWITEGEKDADRLWSEGKVATTNLGGAGKWSDAMSAEIAALGVKTVYLVRDDDDAGAKHAVKVAASLKAAGIKVRHRAPAKGKDVSEHLDAGLGLVS